jgi:hypothetical protein
MANINRRNNNHSCTGTLLTDIVDMAQDAYDAREAVQIMNGLPERVSVVTPIIESITGATEFLESYLYDLNHKLMVFKSEISEINHIVNTGKKYVDKEYLEFERSEITVDLLRNMDELTLCNFEAYVTNMQLVNRWARELITVVESMEYVAAHVQNIPELSMDLQVYKYGMDIVRSKRVVLPIPHVYFKLRAIPVNIEEYMNTHIPH